MRRSSSSSTSGRMSVRLRMDFRIKSSLIIRGEDGAGGAQHHHGGQLLHIKHGLQLPKSQSVGENRWQLSHAADAKKSTRGLGGSSHIEVVELLVEHEAPLDELRRFLPVSETVAAKATDVLHSIRSEDGAVGTEDHHRRTRFRNRSTMTAREESRPSGGDGMVKYKMHNLVPRAPVLQLRLQYVRVLGLEAQLSLLLSFPRLGSVPVRFHGLVVPDHRCFRVADVALVSGVVGRVHQKRLGRKRTQVPTLKVVHVLGTEESRRRG
ncbi:hypothetical protein EYF80_026688 [Liparis tanakae]|uniref:Uncharacterized protein n=1 Tax=Liparis tanakae TaxID=230148 RepID=A0A4Z2HE70_9TELE|nr:hypothetical protein EYF80_026688 [Liparis tanakae]